ncbi:MAG: PKD domain-containing protein [Bacteroidota bacterium]|nr:PKD domain-containing protein [Bacteroidota bacterium]
MTSSIHLRTILSLFVLLTIYTYSFAQNQANIWYFGEYAGIDFNGANPVPLLNSAMDQNEGCATISDENGNLLFYTDGSTVWNSNHDIMMNGTGLLGHPSATQSAVIVPHPGDPDLYYVFTVPVSTSSDGLRYSIVDMTLDGGLGGVTSTKNIFLIGPTEEKVTAVKHGNNNDIWVLTHTWDSDAYYAYLIDNNGLDPTPVVSNVGLWHSGIVGKKIGSMKASPNGQKLAIVARCDTTLELLDFNYLDGTLSNPISFLHNYISGYGIEFSPDGNRLYMTEYSSGSKLYQFDLTAGTPDQIINSETIVGTVSNIHFGALQVATDGKIYASKHDNLFGDDYLGVINNPNELGAACNFVEDGFYLGGRKCIWGLPNFIQSYYTPVSFTYEYTCFGDSTAFLLSDPTSPDSVYWNFGDPASGNDNYSSLFNPKHQYTATGNFTVTLITYQEYFTDTLIQDLTIFEYPQPDLGNDTSICDIGGNTAYFDAGPADSYLWSTGATTRVITPSITDWYWVIATNGNNCSSTDSVYLNMVLPAQVFAGSDTSICHGSFLDISGLVLPPSASNYDSIKWSGGTGSFDDPNILWPTYYPAPSEYGTIELTLTAYATSPCNDVFSVLELTIDSLPDGSFTILPADTVCTQEELSFQGMNNNNTTINTWTWDFGDGNQAEGKNVSHAYGNAGDFEIQLVLTNNSGCTDTIIDSVHILDPQIDFVISSNPSCLGDTILFSRTDNSLPYDCYWEFGDGTNANDCSIEHVYADAGNYEVRLSVCSHDTTKTVTVYPPAISNAGSNESICEGQPFDLSTSAVQPDTTDAVSLLWYGGTGSFDEPTALWPVYTPGPGEEGPVPLYMIAYSNVPCADDTTFMILTLDSLPEPSYTYLPATGICVNEAIQFSGQNNNTTTVSSWNWNFGDGGSSSARNPLYSYATAATYDVTLTLTNGEGCVDSITQQVTVHPLPEPSYCSHTRQ